MDTDAIKMAALAFSVRVAYAGAVLLGGYLAIGALRRVMQTALARTKMGEIIKNFLVGAVSKTCWALVIVAALDQLGVNVGPLIAGLGVTGFVAGFACQDTLSNFASGLMLAINHPFDVGDFVELSGVTGTVRELNMMATTLVTPDNKKLVIPNKVVWGATITNYNTLGTRRVDMTVGVAYGSDLDKAKEVARSVASALPGVLPEKDVVAEVVSLDNSAVTLTVRAWVNAADYWKCYWTGLPALKEAFDKAGISIPFPQMDVHIAK